MRFPNEHREKDSRDDHVDPSLDETYKGSERRILHEKTDDEIGKQNPQSPDREINRRDPESAQERIRLGTRPHAPL